MFPGQWQEVGNCTIIVTSYLWMLNAPEYKIYPISGPVYCSQQKNSCIWHEKFHNSAFIFLDTFILIQSSPKKTQVSWDVVPS